jgi:hypothetical protein
MKSATLSSAILAPALVARHGDAAGINDMNLNPVLLKQPGQPEAITHTPPPCASAEPASVGARRAGLTDSFCNGRRPSSGTVAATSQDVRLISILHTSVLSWSRATRGFSIAVSATRVAQTSRFTPELLAAVSSGTWVDRITQCESHLDRDLIMRHLSSLHLSSGFEDLEPAKMF